MALQTGFPDPSLDSIEVYPQKITKKGGGLLNLGYDLARWLERLPNLAAADLDVPDLCIGLYEWAVVGDHATRQSHLVCAGCDEQSLDEWGPIRALVLGGAAPPPRRPFRVLSAVISNMDRGDYRYAFDRIKRYIRGRGLLPGQPRAVYRRNPDLLLPTTTKIILQTGMVRIY